MRSPGREPTVVDLTKSNAEDATSSFHQTDITYSTNELPEAMSQRQPSFVYDDVVSTNDIGHLSSTNESHTCKDSSSSLFSYSSSSSPQPSNRTKGSSVLLDSHPHYHHDTNYLFQNLSLLDNKNLDVSKPMPRRKLPLSRLLTSSRSDSKKREQSQEIDQQEEACAPQIQVLPSSRCYGCYYERHGIPRSPR